MSANVTTLNQIVQNLKNVADCHTQIHAFKQGDPWEFYTSGVATCTEQWVQILGFSATRNTVKYNLRTWILDAVRRGEANELDVQSDMSLIALDLLAQYRHPSYNWELSYSDTVNGTIFSEHSPYKWSGVWFDFSIILSYPADTCRVPFNPSPTYYPTI
jgi:hypothetical protein